MREYGFRKWIYADRRNFYRVRNIMRRISVHNWHVDIMTSSTSGYGRKAYIEADYRASHKNIDILCEADDICKMIGAVSAAVKADKDVYILERRYRLDTVPMHASITDNEFESMIMDFQRHVSEFGITGDSEYIESADIHVEDRKDVITL